MTQVPFPDKCRSPKTAAREHTRPLPVLMVTSRTSPAHRAEAEKAGVDAYFGKPFSEDELFERLSRAVNA